MTKPADKMYRSEIAAAIHDTISGAFEVGAVSAETMRHFDKRCLVPAPTELTGEDIRALRQRENVSQPIFANYLNVSRNLVSDWERGVKRPGGPALRLLSIVQRKGLQAIA